MGSRYEESDRPRRRRETEEDRPRRSSEPEQKGQPNWVIIYVVAPLIVTVVGGVLTAILVQVLSRDKSERSANKGDRNVPEPNDVRPQPTPQQKQDKKDKKPPPPPDRVATWEPEDVRTPDPVAGEGYVLRPLSARVVGSELTCELTITSKKGRKALRLNYVLGQSTATLDTGDKLRPSSVAFGGEKVSIARPPVEVEQDVPTKLEITFNDAPAKATRVSALTIVLEVGATRIPSLTVRDFELQRQVFR